MIKPVRYSGRSGRSSQASENITAGPITQLKVIATAIARRSATASPMRLNFTFASTGYIITNRPTAMGRETVPILTSSSQSFRSGTSRPRAMPSTIAAPIHAGRKRSSKESRWSTSASAGVAGADVGPVEADALTGAASHTGQVDRQL